MIPFITVENCERDMGDKVYINNKNNETYSVRKMRTKQNAKRSEILHEEGITLENKLLLQDSMDNRDNILEITETKARSRRIFNLDSERESMRK